MITNISVWAVLTLGALLAPITPAAPSILEDKPETSITLMEMVKGASVTPTVVVPTTVQVTFEKVKVTSTPAPKPEPEPKPEPVVEETAPAATTVKKQSSPAKTATEAAAKPVKVSPGSAQAEAASQMKAYGWGADQLNCLVSLWEKESNWKYTAENSSSGAYGIPQSLPGTKMASAGADWRTNPATQIKWGLGYIKDRYKTPCGAWGHSVQVGWY